LQTVSLCCGLIERLLCVTPNIPSPVKQGRAKQDANSRNDEKRAERAVLLKPFHAANLFFTTEHAENHGDDHPQIAQIYTDLIRKAGTQETFALFAPFLFSRFQKVVYSSFVLRHSFVIRHSTFVIPNIRVIRVIRGSNEFQGILTGFLSVS
jgi:hypothetical protein